MRAEKDKQYAERLDMARSADAAAKRRARAKRGGR